MRTYTTLILSILSFGLLAQNDSLSFQDSTHKKNDDLFSISVFGAFDRAVYNGPHRLKMDYNHYWKNTGIHLSFEYTNLENGYYMDLAVDSIKTPDTLYIPQLSSYSYNSLFAAGVSIKKALRERILLEYGASFMYGVYTNYHNYDYYAHYSENGEWVHAGGGPDHLKSGNLFQQYAVTGIGLHVTAQFKIVPRMFVAIQMNPSIYRYHESGGQGYADDPSNKYERILKPNFTRVDIRLPMLQLGVRF